jgi:RimJ/RimL family protein N-acetyltransferase
MNADILRGDRVRLTAVRPDDIPTIARWHDSGAFLRHFDTTPAVPRTETQIAKHVEETQGSESGFIFGIRRGNDDALVGLLELDGISWAHGTTSISIVIGDPAERGKGYGAEALRLALRFAFDELNLHRVELTVFSYNTAAIRTYERLGFVHEGTHREFLARDGQRYDMLLYGLLRHEWRVLSGEC